MSSGGTNRKKKAEVNRKQHHMEQQRAQRREQQRAHRRAHQSKRQKEHHRQKQEEHEREHDMEHQCSTASIRHRHKQRSSGTPPKLQPSYDSGTSSWQHSRQVSNSADVRFGGDASHYDSGATASQQLQSPHEAPHEAPRESCDPQQKLSSSYMDTNIVFSSVYGPFWTCSNEQCTGPSTLIRPFEPRPFDRFA